MTTEADSNKRVDRLKEICAELGNVIDQATEVRHWIEDLLADIQGPVQQSAVEIVRYGVTIDRRYRIRRDGPVHVIESRSDGGVIGAEVEPIDEKRWRFEGRSSLSALLDVGRRSGVYWFCPWDEVMQP